VIVRKALAGCVFLLFVIGLMLFGAAGSIWYWQGWVYWIIFAGSVIAITWYFLKHDPDLIARRTTAGPVAEPAMAQKIIQTAATALFCAELIIPGLDHRYQWSSVPLALAVAGNLLVVAGFVVIFMVFMQNSYAAGVIRIEAEQPVISTGLYGHMRHPMYLGGMLLLIGTPIALGSWWGIPVALALCAVIVVRLLDEEGRLAVELKGYEEYRRKVVYRLLPGVW
jgi:protein-S-isoprenylcysteine O-methyltransferase Ste14